jgi:hypothetical protein
VPVSVKLAGPRPEKVTHQSGEDVAVDDAGNLIVTAREGRGERTVAVWAPGTWVGAEVEDPH